MPAADALPGKSRGRFRPLCTQQWREVRARFAVRLLPAAVHVDNMAVRKFDEPLNCRRVNSGDFVAWQCQGFRVSQR